MHLIENEAETPTTRRVRIALDGRTFAYHAGQAAALLVDSTDATPYSIASAPFETAQQGWLEFLVKVDGSTRFGARVEALAPGTRVDVTGPTGHFTLNGVSPDTPLIFVAGGTGVAPLRSMIHQAIHDGHQAPLSLVYSARSPNEFAYLADFQQLVHAGRLKLTLTLTGQAEVWLHARGRASAEHFAAVVEPGAVAFVCGPPAMVAEVPVALGALGVGREQIRTEHW